MTKQEIVSGLERLGKDRQWLAEATKYTYDYVKNSLAPSAAEPSSKFVDEVIRAFAEEERRREVDLTKPGSSVWDLVFFNGAEVDRITRAKQAGGYPDLPSLYRDAVIQYADELLAGEKNGTTVPFPGGTEDEGPWLENYGGVAAGSPILSDSPIARIQVAKAYPADHYALRVFGNSMEPTIPDGSIIVVKHFSKGRDGGYPKKGTIVVYSDGNGSTLKEFGYRKALPEEEDSANAMGDIPVLRSLNKACPDVQTMEGGHIEATFVEVLPEP